MKIAIQGIKGSFHHIVAQNFFQEDIELIECDSFTQIPVLIETGKADYGIMAIENSIAGAILANYTLIDEYDLAVCGEYYLNIQHNLMSLPGQELSDIKEVYSHPMALLQCRKFFRDYPDIKLVEDVDTADAAKRIKEEQRKGVAAIASGLAAELYQLENLEESIQTVKDNQTRFVVLEAKESKNDCLPNKASIKFGLQHQTGQLGEVLSKIAENKVSLTKIQSLPVIENPWEYEFFADLIFENYNDYKNALIDIKNMVKSHKVLGEYQQNR
jgi:prephenate dehydratase